MSNRSQAAAFVLFTSFSMGSLAACGDDVITPQDLGPDLSGSCTGGPVAGAADSHCQGDGGLALASVDTSTCPTSTGGTADYGATMYGTVGYDDDCKYKLTYSVEPVCENVGVTLTVVATKAVGGAAVTGAKTRAEIFLSDTHPAPNAGTTTNESSPGTYKISPVKFDAAGTWTVRFHFFEDCADEPTSPHGHAAFYLNVP